MPSLFTVPSSSLTAALLFLPQATFDLVAGTPDAFACHKDINNNNKKS
jgi:hypothetical protein